MAKEKGGWLPLYWVKSLGAIVVSAICAAVGIGVGVALIANRSSYIAAPLQWLFGGLGGYAGYLTLGVAALGFGVAGVLFLKKTQKAVAAQPDFIDGGVYRGISFTGITILCLVAAAAAAATVGALITALVTISGHSSITSILLDNCVPAAITAVVAGLICWCVLGIFQNKATAVSALMVLLLGFGGVALVLDGVGVGIRSHNGAAAASSTTTTIQPTTNSDNSSDNSSSNSTGGTSGNSNSSNDSSDSSDSACSNAADQYEQQKISFDQYMSACGIN
ncbi:MAG: hypothetical protein LBM73_03700 [Candidatus Nomurabacteria bacterium]|jgi:hypothetical protein|nr:hypothetical protein [Candidatus Nomurabacteria bacterium]